MKAARAIVLIALLAPAAFGATTVTRSNNPPPRRYRLSDTEIRRHGGFIARIENCLPVALLIFLGFHGSVQVSGDVGPVRVSAGNGTGGR